MNTSGWKGWDATNLDFDYSAVGVNKIISGNTMLGYMRTRVKLYNDLVALAPPNNVFDDFANADPYMSIDDIPADAVDHLARRLAKRSVFWKIKDNPTKVARVRAFYPRTQNVMDSNGNLIPTLMPLNFADFGDNFDAVKGDAE